eukprot:scaffold297_cov108-Isochrysis_galbana.AAC.2
MPCPAPPRPRGFVVSLLRHAGNSYTSILAPGSLSALIHSSHKQATASSPMLTQAPTQNRPIQRPYSHPPSPFRISFLGASILKCTRGRGEGEGGSQRARVCSPPLPHGSPSPIYFPRSTAPSRIPAGHPFPAQATDPGACRLPHHRGARPRHRARAPRAPVAQAGGALNAWKNEELCFDAEAMPMRGVAPATPPCYWPLGGAPIHSHDA